jgi:hypothetical protein
MATQARFENEDIREPDWISLAILGSVPGFMTATFGAWKDTLYEPFEIEKFFRSPLITMLAYVGFALEFPRAHWILLMGAASTTERLLVEIWKSVHHDMPGKFLMGQERDHGWLLKTRTEFEHEFELGKSLREIRMIRQQAGPERFYVAEGDWNL